MGRKKVERIIQTRAWNCGSACLAMVTGLSIADIEENYLMRKPGELRDPEPGKNAHPTMAKTDKWAGGVIGVVAYELQAVLWDLGIRHLMLVQPGPRGCPHEGWYDRVGHDMPALRTAERIVNHLNAHHLAILAVNSLRHELAKHWIVANGCELLDPAPDPGPIYTSMLDYDKDNPLECQEALLIAPGAGAHGEL